MTLVAIIAWAIAFPALAQLKLVATTAELHSLASAVGGEAIVVSHLIPAGEDAESFQPRPQDLARIREARAVLRVGVDYDLWLERLVRQAPGVAVIDASTDVALLDVRAGGVGPGDGHAHGRGNPHYWLDPANAEAITGTILEALAALDPPNAKRFEANRLAFLARLGAKMAQWSTQLRGTGALIAHHDTWPYFARRFRLRFVGFIETRPGIPPSAAHLAELLRIARDEKVRAIVREPHEPRRDADFLAQRTGARVAILASGVGAVPGAVDYISLIDHNVRALAP
jgi:ABC-type Zn uptake system ZnuABC Zn-binding protein ZnuA